MSSLDARLAVFLPLNLNGSSISAHTDRSWLGLVCALALAIQHVHSRDGAIVGELASLKTNFNLSYEVLGDPNPNPRTNGDPNPNPNPTRYSARRATPRSQWTRLGVRVRVRVQVRIRVSLREASLTLTLKAFDFLYESRQLSQLADSTPRAMLGPAYSSLAKPIALMAGAQQVWVSRSSVSP